MNHRSMSLRERKEVNDASIRPSNVFFIFPRR